MFAKYKGTQLVLEIKKTKNQLIGQLFLGKNLLPYLIFKNVFIS